MRDPPPTAATNWWGTQDPVMGKTSIRMGNSSFFAAPHSLFPVPFSVEKVVQASLRKNTAEEINVQCKTEKGHPRTRTRQGHYERSLMWQGQ